MSPERCPSCQGPLRRFAGQVEAYCPSCEIFVEILGPLPPVPAQETSPEENEVRLKTARMYVELEAVLGDDELGDAPPDGSAEPPPTPPIEPPQVDAESQAAPEAEEPAGSELTLEHVDAVLESIEAEESVVSAPPHDELLDNHAQNETVSEAQGGAAVLPRPRGWHRVLFYAGSALVAFGGSGLALGSVLHDVLRVPLFGQSYDAFGNLNLSTALFGALFLLAGIAAMVVGARAGASPRGAMEG